NERAAGDEFAPDPARAAVPGVLVRETGVGHPGGRGAAVSRRAVGARSFANIPAVIGARDCLINLFPCALADVVDEEPGSGGVRIESEAKRIAQAPGESLLTPIARHRHTSRVAPRAVRPLERICRRDVPIARDAQDLAEQHMPVASGVVISACPAVARVVGAAVADADVKESVLAELKIAPIVVAVGRENIINEYDLAPRDD